MKWLTLFILALVFVAGSSGKFPPSAAPEKGTRLFVSHFENVLGTSMELKVMAGSAKDASMAEADLTFFSKGQPNFSLDFSKDKDGNITQVVAFKHDVWVKQNKPALTAAMLKSYEGKYRSQEDPDNEIRITSTDSNLIVRQLWDKKDLVLQPLTNSYFNSPDRSFPLVIVLDEGKVVQVVLQTGNVFNRVPE